MTTSDGRASDPFDLKAIRSKPLVNMELVKETNTVPVRRPGRNQFFRVHPDPEMSVDVPILEHDNERERAIYWVSPDLQHELAEDLYIVRMFTVITKLGTVFLWPVKLPTGGPGDSWHRSALEAAGEAMRWWLKIVGSRELGGYNITKAPADLPAPEWPGTTFEELLRVAFKERVIETTEHHVIREIRGEE